MSQIYEPIETKPTILKLKSYKKWHAEDGFISFQFYLENNDGEAYSVRVNRRLILKFFEDLLEEEQKGNNNVD